MKPIAVLGAGLAGLTAARELRRRGLPVIVFEAGESVGGMASSFKDADGFTYDVGAHFISNRLARELGAEAICRTVPHYGEAVLVGERSRSYPFGLLAEPRFLAGAVAGKLARRKIENAEDWFRSTYGDALAEAVAIPLAEAWSGAKAEALSPAVGEKLSAGVLKTLYLKAASRVTGRAVCNGYSHEVPESASVYHVYPEGGISRLLEPTVAEVAESIRLRSPVEKIIVENDRVVAVRSMGETIPVSAAISTAPVDVLPKLIEGSNALSTLSAFRYRPMVFVNLRFSGRHLLPDTMLWVPDRSKPFFRLTEAPYSMPWLAPEGKTLITADIGCSLGDEIWTMSEADLAARCLEGMCAIDPTLRDRYLGSGGVVRARTAYPVYLLAYEEARRRFAQSTGIEGLISIGRNGEFGHILMEDIYWRTLRQAAAIAAYVGEPAVEPSARAAWSPAAPAASVSGPALSPPSLSVLDGPSPQ
ncbi:protoporphyrinogen/coproporphyrinogen oxidase [Consotaella salsifontis]|uniref:UDP-galactopyranose mutase n=1 Tax=Consotaella salsifontis TaxID=1365950 RepID=A0A1T4R879_9HYPH|nr:FAD-dependent oxidoreductase [Consotaella salsifontis]SKA12290.1 UDP-galactopyranose mutase [Consotaella salsifontis]